LCAIFFFQAEDGIRARNVTGVQTCALPILSLGFPKGYRSGAGAGISTRHALALVNRGGTSADLLALAEEVRAGVEKQFGIRLARSEERRVGKECRSR